MSDVDQTDVQKAYYAVIPANVRYDNDVPPNAKLLYGEITALCNQKGFCWASNDYFAKLYGCSKSSVSRWIRLLKSKGYISIKIVYREGSNEIENRYIQICEYPILKNEYTPIRKNAKDNNTSSFNNTVNKEERKKNSFDEIIDRYLSPDGESVRFKDCTKRRELLQEWLKVRKAKRAVMTDRTIEMNIEKLDETAQDSGMSVVDYLKEVIRRGWAAFFVIKSDDGNQKKGPKETVPNWCTDEYEEMVQNHTPVYKKKPKTVAVAGNKGEELQKAVKER